jgi:hypothetical protein
MIDLKVTKEGGAEIPNVVWLNFTSSDGSGAMINLNDLAVSKGNLVGKAMNKAILEYLSQEQKCKWEEDNDANYDTDCGQTFCMTDGTPKENDFKYCTFCGRVIEEVPYMVEESIDEESGDIEGLSDIEKDNVPDDEASYKDDGFSSPSNQQ